MTASELKELRRSVGLSQGRLAKLIGVQANTVARWEREDHAKQWRKISEPHARLIKIICEKLRKDTIPP